MNNVSLRGVLGVSKWSLLALVALPAALLLGCSDDTDGGGQGGGGGEGPATTGSSGGAGTSGSSSSTSATTGGSVSSTSATTGSSSSTSATTGTGVPTTGTPVERHGWLSVRNSRVVGEHGSPVQLKGMSLFWSQWGSKFYNASAVNTLADEWNATIVRAAMGIDEEGYLTNPAPEKERVRAVVEAAVNKGIYVIIDWHDHNANDHLELSKQYFREVAAQYKDVPNVIFEVFNEPLNTNNWPAVKSYAEAVISEIRRAGATKSLVIVGSPNWSQDADVAADSPLSDSNVAYTLHFYATTHKQFLRDKAQTAMSKGLALFVTEWGTCAADGNGTLDTGEAQTWINFMNDNDISWANWALNDKAEACSALRPGSSGMGPWADNQLTDSGRWVKAKMLED
ncbi:hypothetical protein SOCE26_020140 [Sorangium cellulosum]|uniref:Glycoside hydrolase family 5 domain-containing protein n=1 Tax=Sorangium cellulosum TaxID=56 RepID=A0A2L0EMT3_SORCE|nr:hypothetical protein SOCE26_020140 [Sorangium cellulosum]